MQAAPPSPGVAIGRNDVDKAYGYIGSSEPDRGGIEVFRIEGDRWNRVQRVPCRAPAYLLLHPNHRFLYVANAVALDEGLPRGTVDVFSIDGHDGFLTHVQRQALSLSGTEPRGLAVTPDGQYLIVAVYGGGAYNVLQIWENGTVGHVRRIFKELGCGVHTDHQRTPHPHTVRFDAAGRFLLASDLGCDQLSAFTLPGNGVLERSSKALTAGGAGPGSIMPHPGGSVLYVMNELRPAISCHRYEPSEGIIGSAFQTVPLASGQDAQSLVRSSLAIDSNGRFLYAGSAEAITAMAIHPVSGALSVEHQSASANGLHISSDNRTLHAIHQASGSVVRMKINSNGIWDTVTQVASVQAPVSLAFLAC